MPKTVRRLMFLISEARAANGLEPLNDLELRKEALRRAAK